uniref:C-type lectin domain-containing protein n=1 Tax=Caenorhabditis tropicalis TaxID=1561998 RepID=A0A1I7U9J1_9PELO
MIKMKLLILILATVAISYQLNGQCQFTPFQGLNYALITTNANWNTSNAACIACGAQMMGMPSGANQTFVEQTLGANAPAWSTAWVNGNSGGWCQFYTFKSNGKQFFGTNCESNATYVLCVKQ